MRKLALVLAVCAWIPSSWGQSGSQKKRRVAANSTNQAASDQRGTPESPLIVDTQGHQDSPAEAAEKKREKERRDSIDSSTVRSAEVTAAATVVLMFVGVGGVIAAVRTLRAIQTQAELQGRSINLQERTMQQWVYLTNWKVNRLKSDPRKLRITVDLVNQSQAPMTLRDGEILIEEIGGYTRHSVGESTFLPPNTPMQIEIIVASVPDQLTAFEQGSLSIRVAGAFSHIDRISGNKVEQPVNGWLQSGHWGTIFHWELHMNPVETEQPEGHS